MSEKIGYEQALKDIRATAEGREDYVYTMPVEGEGCLYVHPKFDVETHESTYTPGCIVGTMLINQGVKPEAFIDLRINKQTGSDTALRRLVDYKHIAGYTDKAMRFIAEVQSNQDNEATWGNAIADAIESVKEDYVFDKDENFVQYN